MGYIKTGNYVIVKKGKNDRLVSYDIAGKVVLLNGKNLQVGYALITEIEERDNFYIASAVNKVYDIYPGIDYKTYLEVLDVQGFKMGYDRKFKNPYGSGDEHQILAYDIESGAIIVAETFDNGSCFNSIQATVVNVTHALKVRRKSIYIASGNGTIGFELVNSCDNLSFIREFARTLSTSRVWKENEYPFLWDYSDTSTEFSQQETDKLRAMYGISKATDLWINTIGRILLADKEIESLFKGNNYMEPVFKTR